MNISDLMTKALQGVPESVGDPNLQYRDPAPALAGMAKALYGNLEDTAKGSIQSAGDYAQTGEYNPKPVVDAALMAAGGASPFAEAGAAGIFGGKLAATADQAKLARANVMDMRGHPRQEIWDETGWFKGPEGKWRFEIPDRNAKINGELPKASHFSEEGMPRQELDGQSWTTGGGSTDIDIRGVPRNDVFPLQDIIAHKELYDAYPHMKNVAVDNASDLSSPGTTVRGIWHGKMKDYPAGAMGLGDSSLLGMRSTSLHELQHAVQEHEGFINGGSPGQFTGVSPEEAMLRYKGLPGEMEARNVQARADMTPQQRLMIPPWESEKWIAPGVDPQALLNALRSKK